MKKLLILVLLFLTPCYLQAVYFTGVGGNTVSAGNENVTVVKTGNDYAISVSSTSSIDTDCRVSTGTIKAQLDTGISTGYLEAKSTFTVNGSTFVVLSNGNVGIGISNPSCALNIYKADAPAILRLQNYNTGTGAGNGLQLYSDNAASVINYEGNTLTMGSGSNATIALSSSNTVGVGTALPKCTLHVLTSGNPIEPPSSTALTVQRSAAAGSSVYMDMVSGNQGDTGIWFGDTDDNDIGGINYTHLNDSLVLKTNTTTKLTIDSAGKISGSQFVASSSITTPSIRFTDGTIQTTAATGSGTEFLVSPSTGILAGTLAADIVVSSVGVKTIQIPNFNLTGTPSSDTYLRGDGSWQTPAGAGDAVLAATQTWTGTNTFENPIVVAGTTPLLEGDNVVISTISIIYCQNSLKFTSSTVNAVLSRDFCVPQATSTDNVDWIAPADIQLNSFIIRISTKAGGTPTATFKITKLDADGFNPVDISYNDYTTTAGVIFSTSAFQNNSIEAGQRINFECVTSVGMTSSDAAQCHFTYREQ